MEKLNIAELLKDCPSGMELDCTMFEGLEFDSIVDNSYLPIRCRILNPDGYGYNIFNFTKYGCWNTLESAKCVIFPKGKTTWEGFQRPFKDGDVVFYDDNIAIFKEWGDETLFRTYVKLYIHRTSIDKGFPLFGKGIRKETRLATKEEKQKLFDAIKANEYKWNAEIKTLEKLSEFKAGDVLVSSSGNIVLCSNIDDGQVVHYHCILTSFGDFAIKNDIGIGKSFHCTLATDAEKQRLFDKLKSVGYKYNPQTNILEKLIEPKFKVGDKIVNKNSISTSWIISSVSSEYYGLKLHNDNERIGILPVSNQDNWELASVEPKFKVGDRIKHRLTGDVYKVLFVLSNGYNGGVYDVEITNEIGKSIDIKEQDNYELVPNKFDISTLMAFDRVLVRDTNEYCWHATFYSHHTGTYFYSTNGLYAQCIPFEDNKHLLGTKDDCDEYYKTWE